MYGRKIQNSSFFFPGVVNLERPLERLQEPDENGNPGPFVNKTKCRKERKKTFPLQTTHIKKLSPRAHNGMAKRNSHHSNGIVDTVLQTLENKGGHSPQLTFFPF